MIGEEEEDSQNKIPENSDCNIVKTVRTSKHQDQHLTMSCIEQRSQFSQRKCNSMPEESTSSCNGQTSAMKMSLKETYLRRKQEKTKTDSSTVNSAGRENPQPFYLSSNKVDDSNRIDFSKLQTYSLPTTPSHNSFKTPPVQIDQICHLQDSRKEEINANYLTSPCDQAVNNDFNSASVNLSPPGSNDSSNYHHFPLPHSLTRKYEELLYCLKESESLLVQFDYCLTENGSQTTQQFLKLVKKVRLFQENKCRYEVLIKEWQTFTADNENYSEQSREILHLFQTIDDKLDQLCGNLIQWIRDCQELNEDLKKLEEIEAISENMIIDERLLKKYQGSMSCCKRWTLIFKQLLCVPLSKSERDWIVDLKEKFKSPSEVLRHSLLIIKHTIKSRTTIYCHSHENDRLSNQTVLDDISFGENEMNVSSSRKNVRFSETARDQYDHVCEKRSGDVHQDRNRFTIEKSILRNEKDKPESMLGLDTTAHNRLQHPPEDKDQMLKRTAHQFQSQKPSHEKRFRKEDVKKKKMLQCNLHETGPRTDDFNEIRECTNFRTQQFHTILCYLLSSLLFLILFLTFLFVCLFPRCENYCLVDTMRFNIVWSTSDAPAPT